MLLSLLVCKGLKQANFTTHMYQNSGTTEDNYFTGTFVLVAAQVQGLNHNN